mmetsp:Transcript_56475/g.156347  ORF Transcript_56475/g.156347 Transcript_56475/m.156347 type:complete len:80 (-) Transcript_56475:41-280(-)
MRMAATVPRVIRAKVLGLQAAVQKFTVEITENVARHDLSPLAEHPDLMLGILKCTQCCVKSIHPKFWSVPTGAMDSSAS